MSASLYLYLRMDLDKDPTRLCQTNGEGKSPREAHRSFRTGDLVDILEHLHPTENQNIS